jgi:hypothetical protein
MEKIKSHAPEALKGGNTKDLPGPVLLRGYGEGVDPVHPEEGLFMH